MALIPLLARITQDYLFLETVVIMEVNFKAVQIQLKAAISL